MALVRLVLALRDGAAAMVGPGVAADGAAAAAAVVAEVSRGRGVVIGGLGFGGEGSEGETWPPDEAGALGPGAGWGSEGGGEGAAEKLIAGPARGRGG